MIYKQWAASARAARSRRPRPISVRARVVLALARRRLSSSGRAPSVACILYLYRRFTPRFSSRLRKTHLKTTKVKIAHHDSDRCKAPLLSTIVATDLLISESRTQSEAACSAPRGCTRAARPRTSSALRHFCVTCQLFHRREARARDVSGESRAAGRRRDGVHHAA